MYLSVFHEILGCMIVLAKAIVRMRAEPLPDNLRDDPKFNPFFKDCIGAADGSHYNCLPPALLKEAYRNRKGNVTINVLVVVNLRGRFIYVLSGWEGSAHDSTVFADAVDKKLTIPDGKYLLADAAYPPILRVLPPFRGARYHLQETARRGKRPANKEELFNLRHSQSRIMVENSIGWHKSKFRILTSRPVYSVPVQNRIIFATAGLMNWILDYGTEPELPTENGWYPDLDVPEDGSSGGPGMDLSPAERDASEGGAMSVLRERIATAMWEQYEGYLSMQGDGESSGESGGESGGKSGGESGGESCGKSGGESGGERGSESNSE